MSYIKTHVLGVTTWCVLISFSAGLFVGFNITPEEQAFSVRENNSTYTLINPLLECEVDANSHSTSLAPMEQDVIANTDYIRTKYNVSDLAVYFRDLNNGPWIGIEQDKQFSPASLTKVPVLISVLKLSERTEGLLDQTLTVASSGEAVGMQPFVQTVSPQERAEPGGTYTVRELLRLMIVHSDNEAMLVLRDILDEQVMRNTFAQIGIPFTYNNNDMWISVKQYAAFFRVLYNASYLSRDNSEFALQLLTESAYKRALVAGVPEGTVIAHKFGERAGIDGTGLTQLHDCGIVYHPHTPYLLCVMTRGIDVQNLQRVIQEISKTFYDEVDGTLNKSK